MGIYWGFLLFPENLAHITMQSVLKGIAHRSQIGFLSLFEHYGNCIVSFSNSSSLGATSLFPSLTFISLSLSQSAISILSVTVEPPNKGLIVLSIVERLSQSQR